MDPRETEVSLGSDHLPVIISLPGLSLPPWKKRTYVNFQRADFDGFAREVEERLAVLPLHTSCVQGEKVFREVLHLASKHHIPAGYREE